MKKFFSLLMLAAVLFLVDMDGAFAATAAPSAPPAATAAPVKTPAISPAAQAAAAKAAEKAAQEKEAAEKAAKEAALHAPFDQSLFFSPQDLIAISKAEKGAAGGGGNYKGEPIPQKRVIVLSGIIYRSPNDWLIWLNGQKIAPGHLLPQIVDIQVHENDVHLKWFDIGLNGVIDITMHPHEVYDIVTGILLPGAG